MKGEEIAKIFSAGNLCNLANKFLQQELFDEAIELLKQACELYPDNLTLKVQLGRTRDALMASNHTLQLPPRSAAIREQYDKRASLFHGLAELHTKRLEPLKAIAALQEAIKLNPNNFLYYLALGKIHYQEREYQKACDAFSRGKVLNPFHEDLCYFLGLAYFYLERYEDALVSMVDALVLSGDLEKQQPSPYQQKIQLIMEKFPGFDRGMRNNMIKERQKKFKQFYDTLQREIHAVDPQAPIVDQGNAAAEVNLSFSEEQYRLVPKLKQFFILRNLDDKTLMRIAAFTREVEVKEGSPIYKEKTPVQGLFLVEKGAVKVVKETHLGNIELLQIDEGRFFGEDDLLYAPEHNTTALSQAATTQLLVVDRVSLANLFKHDQPIALHFYWYFWKSLGLQIRHANEQLKSFFTSPQTKQRRSNEPAQEMLRKRDASYQMALNQKEEILRSQGIDTEELKLIAQLCHEEYYNAGEYIFREGSPGDKLYIVAAGEVMIAKAIEGVGEEALAILKKGDFFGEMALVDGDSRSADAKAHKAGTTVLAIKRDVLKEILNMDTASACRFLSLLYRILYHRLNEIREKIYQWKIMAGGF